VTVQALVLALLALLAPQDARVLAIEHVAVIPMDRELVLADQTVVVRDGRIATLGPASSVAVPEDAERVDGTGRYLMPGLADMHVHLWDENELFLFVANGVTTVRNMFGDPLHLAWRARIERGEILGPRIYTAGPIVDGSPPVWPGSVELADPEDAARVVAAQKAAGYDFLKPYANLSEDCYEALAVAAEEQDMRLMGHVPVALGIDDVLEAGQVTIEHLDGWAHATQRPGAPKPEPGMRGEDLAWQKVDDKRLAKLAREMRERGAWNCPTLVTKQKWVTGEAADALLARPEMRYVTPAMLAFWRADSPANYLVELPASTLEAARAALPFQSGAVAALRTAGAGILLGTDMGNPYVVAGFAVHEELELLVAAGLTPYEALRAATAAPAQCMDAADAWGTLAEGRSADLLLLEANPLVDVRNAAKRAGVVVAGRWLSEGTLRAELELRATAFEAR
jgi:imidazolonepropionase-like amidohydrolase